MREPVIKDGECGEWIRALKERLQNGQLKAAVPVNQEKLAYYLSNEIVSPLDRLAKIARQPVADFQIQMEK